MDHDSLGIDGQLFKDAVRKEIFYMKSKAVAKKAVDSEAAGSIEIPSGVLIDAPMPPEPPELIPGILLRHGATGIVGSKETGKSLVALEIQHSLLTGQPLWGEITPSTTLDKTVHIIAEHTSSTLQGLYQRTQLTPTGRLHVFGPEHMGAMKLLVSNGSRREEAISFYKRMVAGAGLVVFDPLAAFIQGESAENDNAPMRSLIDSMIEVAQSTNAGCLVLCHKGKPLYFQGKEMKKSSYALRGASAAEDALTAVHYLDRQTGVTIDGRQAYELSPTHYKGFKAKPFVILRDSKTCLHTLKGSKVSQYS